MKSLLLVIFCFTLSSPSALSQNNTCSDVSFEYARQAFMHMELPVYSVHFSTQLSGYLKNTDKTFCEQLPGSLSILDWTALTHLFLFLGSVYENGEVPGFRSQNATTLDRVLIADNELLMPSYGALVAYLKTCILLGYCIPDGTASLAIDQYFAIENVVRPILASIRKSMNNGEDAPLEESQVIPTPSFTDTMVLMPYGNAMFFSTGLVQLLALGVSGSKSPYYQRASSFRALYMVAYFAWLGYNNLPMLKIETIKILSHLLSQLGYGTTETKQDL